MSPGEGLETRRTGKPGMESVVDKNFFACLVSISSSSGNCTQSTGKVFAYWLLLPLSRCGNQADELQFGDIYGTIWKEKLCFETSRPDRCKSKVIGGHLAHKVLGGMWLIHISMKSTQRKAEAESGKRWIPHLHPAMPKLATWTSSLRDTFPFRFYLSRSAFPPTEMKITINK